MTEKTVITREMAEVEFDRFADEFDIELELDGMDENDRRDNAQSRAQMVRAIERGRLVIEEDGTPVQRTGNGDELRWKRPTGAAWIAMDKKKKTAEMAKAFASMAEITGVSAVVFAKMYASDVKLALAIWSLFLA